MPYQTVASNPGRALSDNVHGVNALFQDCGQMKNRVNWIQDPHPSTLSASTAT